ncbi:DUF2989 domain-containing protein [Idiomarina sp. HP20-50]|uniref:DUF2989 domain-containing protein n=1 Tax=Idiomarina sp. HP20-50 TaxID=3070813 RepID=UPI00294ACCDE|nr:DUF2989 domain-containing protein [Idiomarina sp. HP20-50]MDV6315138.1 DUF2989 domain-containing protein [Idiomarina sp. HP20-50]
MTSVVIALTGCVESKPTVREICQASPALCSDLNDDNWCNSERRQLIFSRYKLHQKETSENQYFLMRDLQTYAQCIELASTIEHKKLKSKQSSRIEAFINSQKNIKQLAERTADSEHPLWLYWHWSNRGNEEALQKLLALEGTPKLEKPELKLALATYYAKHDSKKTFKLLYNAMRLYRPGDRINPEIPSTLVSMYLKEEKPAKAYIWSQVAWELGQDNLDKNSMKNIVNASDAQYEQWDEQAQAIVEKLRDGNFRGYYSSSS